MANHSRILPDHLEDIVEEDDSHGEMHTDVHVAKGQRISDSQRSQDSGYSEDSDPTSTPPLPYVSPNGTLDLTSRSLTSASRHGSAFDATAAYISRIYIDNDSVKPYMFQPINASRSSLPDDEYLSLPGRDSESRAEESNFTSLQPALYRAEQVRPRRTAGLQQFPKTNGSFSVNSPVYKRPGLAWTRDRDCELETCSRRGRMGSASDESAYSASPSSSPGRSSWTPSSTEVNVNDISAPSKRSPPPPRLDDPVRFWLNELAFVHEAECTIMLQSKPFMLSRSQRVAGQRFAESNVDDHSRLMRRQVTISQIQFIQNRAHAISTTFARLCKQFETSCAPKMVPPARPTRCASSPSAAGGVLLPTVKELHEQITSFLYEFRSVSCTTNLDSLQSRLEGQCASLQYMLANERDVKMHLGNIVGVLAQIGSSFTQITEAILSAEVVSQIKCLRSQLDILSAEGSQSLSLSPTSESLAVVLAGISSLASIAVEGGDHICRLLVNSGFVQILIGTTCSSHVHNLGLKSACIRALSSMSSTREVHQILLQSTADLMSNCRQEVAAHSHRSENAEEDGVTFVAELAGLTAQLLLNSTGPDTGVVRSALVHHSRMLVAKFKDAFMQLPLLSTEYHLLLTAGLANLVIADSTLTAQLSDGPFVRRLDEVFNANLSRPSTHFMFVCEQVVSLITSIVPLASADIISCGWISSMAKCLEIEPAANDDGVGERIKQTTCMAISRLCSTNHRTVRLQLIRELQTVGMADKLVRLASKSDTSDSLQAAMTAVSRKVINLETSAKIEAISSRGCLV